MNETQLQQKMVTLRTRLLIMCASVKIALDNSCVAFLQKDEGRAHAVMEADDDIDALENEIDEKALSLLAREQPFAGDLRMVVTALRMVTDLERIADEAVNIAERAILMNSPTGTEHGAVVLSASLREQLSGYMQLAQSSFAAAVFAFHDSDSARALEVRKNEDEAEPLEMKIMQSIMRETSFERDPWTVLHLILVTRSVNRVLRRSANIAEHVYFACSGKSLKHTHPEDTTAV